MQRSPSVSTPLQTLFTKPTQYSFRPQDARGQKLRRFYVRGLTAVLIPPLVTAYYFFIWFHYLRASPANSQVFFGPRGGLWVYYSWFVIGVIGLNLSSYGFEGIEASMLMDLRWAARDAMMVMTHGEHSWGGPGGWLKTTRNLFRFRSGKGKAPTKLWILLSILSLLVFIALPLSGLVMNFGSGFVTSKQNPLVTGFNYNSFNLRNINDVWAGAGIIWQYNFGAHVPGMGVIYTPTGIDRSDPSSTYLQTKSLPTDDGISQIFLAPQAEVPIAGNTWGLTMKYNCSIVTDLSDFTILSLRNGSKTVASSSNTFQYYNSNNDTIGIYNRTNSLLLSAWAQNLEAVMEFGLTSWPKFPVVYDSSYTTSCYYNAKPDVTGRYPAFDQELALEVLLWQYLQPQDLFDPNPVYNTSISSTIPSLFGAYKSDSGQSMSAIGVRCLSSSAVGTADIDGVQSTFSNFQATDTPIHNQTNNCAERFDPLALYSMFNNIFIGVSGQATAWLSTLFSSVSAPPAFYAQYADDPDDEGSGLLTQLSMLQANNLRSSMLRAHGAYAVQLMYNGGQGFSASDGSHGATFINENVTGFVATTVLQNGVVNPIYPAVLLCIWASGSLVLGLLYGLRRRWAPTLDGWSLFVFGLDLSEQVKSMPGLGLGATLDYENAHILKRLPGLVGDIEPEAEKGRIGLVSKQGGETAKPGRFYI
ncbi:hypothetical protein N431DRAFT_560869 [Stipitochalara longipes BDJ]|nr:hypothetical protein N431DRAFT_560869 [Stipitochalara longipes BDJ]